MASIWEAMPWVVQESVTALEVFCLCSFISLVTSLAMHGRISSRRAINAVAMLVESRKEAPALAQNFALPVRCIPFHFLRKDLPQVAPVCLAKMQSYGELLHGVDWPVWGEVISLLPTAVVGRHD